MAYFADAEELYDVIGRLHRSIAEDPELTATFAAADTVVRYRYTDPEAQITVSLKLGEPSHVDFGESDLEPEVVMTMSADTAHLFWLGKVNATLALARGEMTAEGPVAKLLRLIPAAEPVFAIYRAQLAEQGLTELASA